MSKTYYVDEQDMTEVADTIRTKTGTTDKIVWPQEFKSKINSIEGSGSTSYVLPVAKSDQLGGVKIGTGLLISPDGTLSIDPARLEALEDQMESLLQGYKQGVEEA